jgi:glutamate synthase (NADPH/NADH) large chain
MWCGFRCQHQEQASHDIIEQGLLILKNLDHRGAVGADKLMGDGAGILIQIPDEFYRAEMAAQGVTLPPPGEYGVGMVFLPKEHASVWPASRSSNGLSKPRVRRFSAGVTCRWIATCR